MNDQFLMKKTSPAMLTLTERDSVESFTGHSIHLIEIHFR